MNPFVWVPLLMCLGLMLLVIEIVVVPGVGIVGFLGLSGVLGAVYLAFTGLPSAWAGATCAMAALGTLGAFLILPKTKWAKSMVLTKETKGSAVDPRNQALLGKVGVAKTPLRPAGTAEIDGTMVDVVTEGGYVEEGTEVKVITTDARIVVAPVS